MTTPAAVPIPATPDDVVASLRATAVRVPLARPVRTASGTVDDAPLVLVDLRTARGVEGRAWLFAYTPLALAALKAQVEALAALVVGQPLAPFEVERRIDARFRLLGRTGLVAMAAAGVDMALWDALARGAGLPLARLLGGRPVPVPAYASEGMDGPDEGARLARAHRAAGHTAMKIKIGYPTLAQDLQAIAAVRDALGPDAALAVDYNQSRTAADVVPRTRALDGLGLAWIEEPLAHDDDAGHARLADALSTPLMLGENWFGTQAMARSLAAGACDLAMPDLMKIGGVTGWLRAASLAEAARMPMGSHLFQEQTAHVMAVTPGALRLEVLDLAGPVLARPLRVADGHAWPVDEPGSGIDWNADAVARFRVG